MSNKPKTITTIKQMKEQDIPIPNKGNALNDGDDVILK